MTSGFRHIISLVSSAVIKDLRLEDKDKDKDLRLKDKDKVLWPEGKDKDLRFKDKDL